MNIDWLITEMSTIGGAETYVRNMAPRLQKLGNNLRVISLISGGILLDELRYEDIPVFELGVNSKSDLQAMMKLRHLWRTEKPTIVHTHLYHAGIFGRILAKMMGIQTVIIHQHGAERARSSARTFIDRVTSPFVSQYVATCQAVSEIMQKREGISKKKISIIYNGVEQLGRDAKELHLVNIETNHPLTIINVGRLSAEKGHHTLLEAIALLDPTEYPIQLQLVGDGKLKSDLVERAEKPDLKGRVAILGPRRDAIDLMRKADLFVLPSDWEGVSMALLEAMAVGLPVVATAVGGTPEVVIEGVTGLLTPPQDISSLSSAIACLINQSDIRWRMGEAGRQRVTDAFNIDQTVNQTQTLYEEMMPK